MAVRELLEQFQQIAQNPEKQKDAYLAAGKKVVLCAPVYTPEEIVHSMGMVPMGAWGGDIEVEKAKEYFPAFICSIMQSILELGMIGTYKGCSALIVPSLCDSLKTLGQNWKYAVKDIPFIPMTYPQHRQIPAGKDFTVAGYERVIRDLEQATGLKFDPAKLAESINVYNEHNEVMRRISDLLADHPEVSAAARSDVFKSATFMMKEEHTALVKQLIAELGETPAQPSDKLRVFTSGIVADSPSLLEIFDDCGMQIVADDVAAQTRQYRTDAPTAGDPVDCLAAKFCAMDHCSVLYDVDKKRADLIVETAKAKKAQGVVVVLTKFCDPEEFDYVIIKKACDAANIPVALIEIDRQMVNYEQARTILESFKDVMRSVTV